MEKLLSIAEAETQAADSVCNCRFQHFRMSDQLSPESCTCPLYRPPTMLEQVGTKAFDEASGERKEAAHDMLSKKPIPVVSGETFFAHNSREANQSIPESNFTEIENFMRFMLHKYVRCVLIDGRMLVGRFMCIDRLCNLILDDVIEYRPVPLNESSVTWKDTPQTAAVRKELRDPQNVGKPLVCSERYLNLAMINKKRLVRIFIESKTWEDARTYASTTKCESST